jgi:purine-binding chemotaxis protein CheW
MPDFLRSTESISHQSSRDNAAPQAGRRLLIFQFSERLAAFQMEYVERVTPMAELGSPPGLPAALEGVLNLGGVAIPVLRLDRLFGLPSQRLGLYSMLVILNTPRADRIAILADRVSEVLIVPENKILPTSQDHSFNGCTEAVVAVRNDIVHILSIDRMLLAREREALSEFQAMAQRRLQDWETSQA